MFEIRKATLADIPLINQLAWIVFPHTYKDILSPEQIDYMMEWMYSPTNLKKQMTEDGHIYYLAFRGDEPAGYLSIQPESEHLYHLQKIYVLPQPFYTYPYFYKNLSPCYVYLHSSASGKEQDVIP